MPWTATALECFSWCSGAIWHGGAYSGGGWVRVAILAVAAITLWGGLNAPSLIAAWHATTLGDLLAKALALVALGVMLRPEARHWFAHARELRARE